MSGAGKVYQILSNNYLSLSLRQYKRKVKLWSLERNIKLDDSKFMVHKYTERKHEGKPTTFTVNGREVTQAKFARIRRKLFRAFSPANPYIYTPNNIRYYTPRDAPAPNPSAHSPNQRRPSQSQPTVFSLQNTHLIECFLCQVITYGLEIDIMQAFQSHILLCHPGYDVLRCLNGHDASNVPNAIRTTQQLPSNQVGYVHGVRTDPFDTVRLGRLCHVGDEGGASSANTKRPYLTLTHASSCLTLRGEPRPDIQLGSAPTPLSPFAMTASMEFGHTQTDRTSLAPIPTASQDDEFQDEFDRYFDQVGFPQDEYAISVANFDEWEFEDDQKDYWRAQEMY